MKTGLNARWPRAFLGAVAAFMVFAFVGGAFRISPVGAATAPCNLVPQLRDVTVNQGVGAYSPLVNGKETLVRFYLSMPSCAASGNLIKITGGTLTLSGGVTGTVQSPTPTPSPTAYPAIATFTAAPMTNSTGDPTFVVPSSLVTAAGAFTASFATTITYQSQTSSRATPVLGSISFSTRPGSTAPISASFAGPSNAIGILAVPMGDATKTYSTQWSSSAQQVLQDGMTGTFSRAYPVPAATGALGGTGGLRYTVSPTLLDLKGLNLLDATGKFCGTGGSYDLIKAQLAQFLLSYNTANPNAKANRVIGVIDPAIALGPPNPCFEGMAVVNSQEAWAQAIPGRFGQIGSLEVAHTLGLTPPNRESPFDGAHSQNVTAENPLANRRFNVVQRSFIATDRSLMKPSATSPSPDNLNTLLETPDWAFLLCDFGGPTNSECQTYGPGTVSATAPAAASLSFVMSGTTTDTAAGICATCTGVGAGTSVVESYFSSNVLQTAPDVASTYRLVQRAPNGVISNVGVPVSFRHSEHGNTAVTETRSSGLFSLALPFDPATTRIELWKGTPGAGGSLLLYARNKNDPPVVTLSTGTFQAPGLRAPARADARASNAPTSRGLQRPVKVGSVAQPAVVHVHVHKPTHSAVKRRIARPLQPFAVDWFSALLRRTATDVFVRNQLAGATFTVNSADDTADGTCDASHCSLREAIAAANANTDQTDTIGFAIGEGAQTINLESELPAITDPVVIDGTTQPGFDGKPIVVLNGGGIPNLGSFPSGLTVASGGGTSTIRGLVVQNFSRSGIVLLADGNTIEGNYVGTDLAGTAAAPNATNGITIDSADNTVGGATPAQRNLISGNNTGVSIELEAAGNSVLGNYIGTNAGGTAAIAQSYGVVVDGGTNNTLGGTSGTTPGGPCTGACNLISGNTSGGVFVDEGATDNLIRGNFIGTNASGTGAIPNTQAGVELCCGSAAESPTQRNTIGGTTASARNVISGNAGVGILFRDDGAQNNLVEGNYIGTTAAGTAALPNDGNGIELRPGARANTIGAAGAGNVVSGNHGNGVSLLAADGNVVAANFIGTNANGTAALANGVNGVHVLASSTQIGGVAAGTGNVISGNRINGIRVEPTETPVTDNAIRGNYVGTDVTGTADLGNAGDGIRIETGSNTVGGLTAAARNVVSGNTGHGIFLHGATANVVQGNYAGTNATGTAAIGNGIDGIAIDGGDHNTIGGSATAGAGNLASGNTNQGVSVFGVDFATSTDNIVQGNRVGVQAAANDPLPNGGDGIRLHNASNTLVGGTEPGDGNLIRANGQAGVAVLTFSGRPATGNRILRNSIGANAGLGIDLGLNGLTPNDNGGIETPPDTDAGPNNFQNFPVLASAEQQGSGVHVTGTISSTPSTTFRIDYYASASCDPSGNGEGERWIGWGNVTTAVNGQGAIDTGADLTGPTSIGERITATATDPSGNTSEFSACREVISALPPGQETAEATATDDFPADDKLDVFLNCPNGMKYVIAVGLSPDSVTSTKANWSFNYDASLTPSGCALQAVATDGFNRAASSSAAVVNGPNTLVPSITSPRQGQQLLQYSLIPLRGDARDGNGPLADSALSWSVTGPGISRAAAGRIVDLSPPQSGGWPAGSYTATLSATSGSQTKTASVTFTIVTDADNDGIPATVESQACFRSGDDDPLNAFVDYDGDGLVNANDPQPCTPAATSTAIVDFNPDPLPMPSSGTTVTVDVRVPGRSLAQILASSVRLTRIADADVSNDPRFQNIAWTIMNGVGTAKFDRQKLLQYLQSRNLHNRVITLTIAGRSGAPAWSFEGSDTTLVQG